jgi:hypothetical protein
MPCERPEHLRGTLHLGLQSNGQMINFICLFTLFLHSAFVYFHSSRFTSRRNAMAWQALDSSRITVTK